MLRGEDGRRRYAQAVRGLLKIAMVGALVALFGVAAWALSGWWAGEARHAAVRVVVVPPPPQQGGEIVPIRAYAGLFVGRPRPLEQGPVVVDDDERVDLEQNEPRFSLRADQSDGSQFFVHAFVQMGDYEVYCVSRALPRMRVVEANGEQTWVAADTGRPLGELTLVPRERCSQQ